MLSLMLSLWEILTAAFYFNKRPAYGILTSCAMPPAFAHRQRGHPRRRSPKLNRQIDLNRQHSANRKAQPKSSTEKAYSAHMNSMKLTLASGMLFAVAAAAFFVGNSVAEEKNVLPEIFEDDFATFPLDRFKNTRGGELHWEMG